MGDVTKNLAKDQEQGKDCKKTLFPSERINQRADDLIYSIIKFTEEGNVAKVAHNSILLKKLVMDLFDLSCEGLIFNSETVDSLNGPNENW